MSAPLALPHTVRDSCCARRWLSSRTLQDTHAASGHPAPHFAPRAEHAKSIRPMSARAVLNTQPVSRPTSARTTGKLVARPASAYVTRQAAFQGAGEKLRGANRPSSVRGPILRPSAARDPCRSRSLRAAGTSVLFCRLCLLMLPDCSFAPLHHSHFVSNVS
jgi:hypothetical protein